MPVAVPRPSPTLQQFLSLMAAAIVAVEARLEPRLKPRPPEEVFDPAFVTLVTMTTMENSFVFTFSRLI